MNELTTTSENTSGDITVKWDSNQWATQAQYMMSTNESLHSLDIGNLTNLQLDLLVKLFGMYKIFYNFKVTPNHLIGICTTEDFKLAIRLRDMVRIP